MPLINPLTVTKSGLHSEVVNANDPISAANLLTRIGVAISQANNSGDHMAVEALATELRSGTLSEAPIPAAPATLPAPTAYPNDRPDYSGPERDTLARSEENGLLTEAPLHPASSPANPAPGAPFEPAPQPSSSPSSFPSTLPNSNPSVFGSLEDPNPSAFRAPDEA